MAHSQIKYICPKGVHDQYIQVHVHYMLGTRIHLFQRRLNTL